MATHRTTQAKTDGRTTVSTRRRPATATFAVLLLVTSLLGFSGPVQAAPGDFSVVGDDERAGKGTEYSVAYFTEGAISGGSQFIVSFPAHQADSEYELDPDDPDAVTHEYSGLTHEWDITTGTDADGDRTWDVRFNISRDVAADEKIAFDVNVLNNPADPGDYTIDAVFTDGSGGGLLGNEFTATTTVTIEFAAPGEGEVLIDIPDQAGESEVSGELRLTPAADTAILDVTLPFEFEFVDDGSTDWDVQQQKVDDPDDDSNDRPWIIRYQLDPGEGSPFPFGKLDLTPYAGSFTFVVVERESNQAQVRSTTVAFDVLTNDIDVDYTSSTYAERPAAFQHVLRLDITPSNTLGEDDVLTVGFPAGFDLSNVAGGDVDLEGESGGSAALVAEGGTSIDTAANTITFTLAAGESLPADEVALLIVRDLISPSTIGTTEAFHIRSTDQDGRDVDDDESLTFKVVARGSLSDLTLSASTDPSPAGEALAGQPAKIGFSATIDTADPGSLRIYFPKSIKISDDPVTASVSDGEVTVNSTGTVEEGLHAVTLSLDGLNLASGDVLEGQISGFDYPIDVGQQAFIFRTLSSAGGETDTGSASIDVVKVSIGALNVTRENDVLSENGSVSIKFQTHGLLVDGSKVRITFSQGYDLSAMDVDSGPTGVTINDVDVAPGNTTVSGQAILMQLTTETAVGSGEATIRLDSVKNPAIRPAATDGGSLTLDLLEGSTTVASGTADLGALVLPDDAPPHLYLTQEDIKAANRLIEITAEATEEGILVSWELPSGVPKGNGVTVPPAGVQVWSSSSPYTLLATYDSGDQGFEDQEHLEDDGDDDATYLVTMFYDDDVGRFTGNDAPDTDDYEGTTVTEAESGRDGWTWQWFIIGFGALLLIALAVLLVVRARRY